MGNFLGTIISWATTTGLRLIVAIIVLIVAFKLINFLTKKLEQNEKLGKLDKTLRNTVLYVIRIAAKVLVLVSLIAYVGIDTSSITALIASMGVCVGLAVNGAVGNFAGGLLLILTRPFNVDDFVEVAGYTGTVEEIRLCHTKIRTLDNRIVYVPNSTASSGTVVNYSEKELRRVDLSFNISYSSDIELAKKILADLAAKNELVLKDPETQIVVVGGDKFSTEIADRMWVNSADYWTVYCGVLEEAKKAFGANGIEVPFDRVDVRIKEK